MKYDNFIVNTLLALSLVLILVSVVINLVYYSIWFIIKIIMGILLSRIFLIGLVLLILVIFYMKLTAEKPFDVKK